MSSVVTVIERAKVDAINHEHALCERAYGEAVKHAIECGRMLAAVKADLAHGDWLPWLEEHFAGSRRTAQTYMQLASAPDGDAQRVADLSLRQARDAIAKPRASSPRDAVGMVGALEDDDAEPAGRLLPERIDQAQERLRAATEGAWTDTHARRGRRIDDLLNEALALRGQATQPGLTTHAVAQLLRGAETKARQATGQLSELAFSFER